MLSVSRKKPLFSGIVEEVGKIVAIADKAGGRRLKIGARTVTGDLKLGDSISVSGACLTAVSFGPDWFEVECTFQTLRCTGLGSLKVGRLVNLERALKVSDRLGGHLVTGHVDGLGQVTAVSEEGFSRVITFSAPATLSAFFVEKGSVAVDGVSLTVAELPAPPDCADLSFCVALIPHTLEATTLGQLKVGDPVNLEADLIAKYVARWMEPLGAAAEGYRRKFKNGGLTFSFLSEHGYTGAD